MSTERATSFGAAAAAYERGRSGYPEAALDFLLAPGARRLLDLGAGTGKLTRQLVARGLEVTAVEPLEEMRAELTRVLPDVRTLAGTAEAIPLPDGSVDAVVVGQAWHWVDPMRALPEVARVLVPSGRLGLVWNRGLEPAGSWVAALAQVVARWAPPAVVPQRFSATSPFGPDETTTVAWTRQSTPDGLVDDITSRSQIITLAHDERVQLVREVRELLATHPDTAGRAELAMPHETFCVRAELFTPAG